MATQIDDFDQARLQDGIALPPDIPLYLDNSGINMPDFDRVTTDLSQVTNADFASAAFRVLPEHAHALISVKWGDPEDGGWTAMPAETRVRSLSVDANTYINCASFRHDTEGKLRAKREYSVATHIIMLDDVGTKVHLSRLSNFELSSLVETSPCNHQACIFLDPPVMDKDVLDRLLNSIIAAGLCDSGSTGPASRWLRLPQGINGKPKHMQQSGKPFRCRLVQWNPERRYTVDQVVDGLGVRPFFESSRAQRIAPPLVVPTDVDGQQRMLVELKALLAVLDADCGYRDWLNVLMGVYHSTDGSDEGLALVDEWSSTSAKYKGPKELEIKWRSFKIGTQNPVTIRTLRVMAGLTTTKSADVDAPFMPGDDEFEQCTTSAVSCTKVQAANDEFELCPTIVVSEVNPPQVVQKAAPHPLGKYSISNDVEALERQMVEQVPLLGNIALMGQATALFAAPNTGKTLLTLRLLTDAIDRKALDPKKLYYLNMDDNSVGLLEKAKIASEYGFEMLADGYKGFQSSDFRKAMESMIETDTAHGVAVVIDTLKKFTDTMDKGRSSDFSKVIRRFCLHGGTVVVLGHVNKNPGAGGKKVYAGTTDIVDDFDCAYILDTLSVQPQPGWKVVEFENIKRRGNMPESVAYRYKSAPGTAYDAMLMSVEEEDYSSLLQLKDAAEVQNEMPIIEALRSGISEGATKMKLIVAVAQKVSLSRNIVAGVLDKYTGTDPVKHYWQFVVGARGAKTFALHGQGEQMAA